MKLTLLGDELATGRAAGAAADAAAGAAAEDGHAGAQYSLGLMYESGSGVKKDCTEALRWYHLAAGQGLEEAQSRLGFMYMYSKGVKQDPKKAIQWFQHAGHAAELQYAGGAVN